MAGFTFKKSAAIRDNTPSIEEGVHCAVITQVASVGLQKAFDKDAEPELNLAVAFELESGELVAKRMKSSSHLMSTLYSIFTSAIPNFEESDNDTWELTDLLGKSVLIDVEVRDGKWPRVTAIMPLEEGFEPVTARSELLTFDADEMDREVYLKLHRDIRSWVSKRIRHQ